MVGEGRATAIVAAALGLLAFAPGSALAASDQPNWKYFTKMPAIDGSDADRRLTGCFPVNAPSLPCTINERNPPSAATAAWDRVAAEANPTFTTRGDYADTGLAPTSAVAPPGDRSFRPVSVTREYNGYPWTDGWRNSGCDPANLAVVPPADGGTNANDINAAIVNVFAAHNNMHDWSAGLGFTPARFNMEAGDPVHGYVQAGSKTGPALTFSGRDAANHATPADGTSPSLTSYLWQPIGGAYYPRCVDGSFDISLLAHEYAHAIANRMVGGPSNGLTSTADGQALAIGEGFADYAAVAYMEEHAVTPADDEDPVTIGPYVTGAKARGVRNYSMAASPLNYSNVQGWDGSGRSSPADDGEIWAAVNYDIRLSVGVRRATQIAFDALLTMPANATMVDARDAYIAAALPEDRALLWTAFARRGIGSGAASSGTDDADPEASFESPLRDDESTVTFAPPAGVEAELYAGDYEAGVTPVADTDPATTRDAAVNLVPGRYSFVVRAGGRGAHRFERDIPARSNVRLAVDLPANTASASAGATITGDGVRRGELIDETEATNWEQTGAPVADADVTVDLAGGGPQTIDRVNVSALLQGTDTGLEEDSVSNQNRFTALRKFALSACSAACGNPASFTQFYVSPDDAFPGAAPRPLTPDLNLRSFDVPDTTATHLRLEVVDNQCTGSSLFTDATLETDTTSTSDCRASGGIISRKDQTVRAAELQVFSSAPTVTQTNAPKPRPPGPPSKPPVRPGSTPPPPTPPARDASPRLRALSLSRRRFRRGSRGTVIRYRLSEAARVRFTFQRRRGRRWVRAGAITRRGRSGRNRLRFKGRLSRRRSLRPGRYRLVVVATDSAGQRSARRTARFTLLRPAGRSAPARR